jgi:tetratricopeptide (TPR) repeat protein
VDDTAALLRSADAARERGAWAVARASFEAALERGPSAEALAGLGSVLWWLGETGAAVRAQERAYAEFRRRREPAQAALAAVGLCLLYRASLGNYAASRGWLGRLARLVVDFELAPLAGWVALCRAVTANDSNEPRTAEPWAREAGEVARRDGDPDLELCALAELGTALTQAGKAADGATLLDEAMAGALAGEALRPESVVFVACRTIVCCSRARQVVRADPWLRPAEDLRRVYGGLQE